MSFFLYCVWCRFRESFQDNGDVDPVASMKALRDIGFTGPIRPDHVPTLDGESNENPGYEMLGRLWAIGYIKVCACMRVLRGC